MLPNEQKTSGIHAYRDLMGGAVLSNAEATAIAEAVAKAATNNQDIGTAVQPLIETIADEAQRNVLRVAVCAALETAKMARTPGG